MAIFNSFLYVHQRVYKFKKPVPGFSERFFFVKPDESSPWHLATSQAAEKIQGHVHRRDMCDLLMLILQDLYKSQVKGPKKPMLGKCLDIMDIVHPVHPLNVELEFERHHGRLRRWKCTTVVPAGSLFLSGYAQKLQRRPRRLLSIQKGQ